MSKLNTQTGCEVARYKVCNDPSRTAVDLDGMASSAAVETAVSLRFLNDCIDKNGNGKIETSGDNNNNCTISGNEMVGNDECVVWQVYPDGATEPPASTKTITSGLASTHPAVSRAGWNAEQTLKSFNLTKPTLWARNRFRRYHLVRLAQRFSRCRQAYPENGETLVWLLGPVWIGD